MKYFIRRTKKEMGEIFSAVFRCNLWPELVSDVISGVIIDPTGVMVLVKFGYSRSNRSQDIRLPHFVTNNDAAHACHHIRAKRRYK